MDLSWAQPLVTGTLLRRYKRFLADVELDDGAVVTVHCPNTGAMTGCAEPGWRVWLSESANPRRKYRFTWELVQTSAGMACIHSALANRVARSAIERGAVESLNGFSSMATEVRYGDASRVDLLLKGDTDCFVEVKSVTLALGGGLGVFPDAVSRRGARHLRELAAVRSERQRAALLFMVFHEGIDRVAPADLIDPAYGEAFREALPAGVEMLACSTAITPSGIRVTGLLPVLDRQPG